MKMFYLIPLLLLFVFLCNDYAKKIHSNKMNLVSVKKHQYILSSDNIQGRKVGVKGIKKAARYLENEFKRVRLKSCKDLSTYRQTSFTFKPRQFKHGVASSHIIGVLEGNSTKESSC